MCTAAAIHAALSQQERWPGPIEEQSQCPRKPEGVRACTVFAVSRPQPAVAVDLPECNQRILLGKFHVIDNQWQQTNKEPREEQSNDGARTQFAAAKQHEQK